MTAPYRIETLVYPHGERLPMLIVSATGMPDFYPTVYTAAALRLQLAPNSITAHLRAIMVMYAAATRLRIDIQERIFSGAMLALAEVEKLAKEVRKPIADLWTVNDDGNASSQEAGSAEKKIASIRKSLSRTTSRKQPRQVTREFCAARLLYIHAYLKWLSDIRLARLSQTSAEYPWFKENRDRMLSEIRARIADPWGRFNKKAKLGLSDEARAVLFEVIIPNSPSNPWVREHTAFRNFLIVLLLLKLGNRRGELLAIKTGDIKYFKRRLEITRRPDDPDDTRARQPLVKTSGRDLPLGDILLDMLAAYVTKFRNNIPGAKRHPFVFVSEYTGAPLSLEAVNLFFRNLQNCHPLLADLVPHTLRYTCNYDLGEEADKAGWTEAEEDKVRKYWNGWSPQSKMVDHYNQRRIQAAAARASLSMQQDMPLIKRREVNKG